MKEKHLKIFAAIFVLLIIVYFVTKPRHTSVNPEELVHTIIIGVSKSDIKSIEVYKETSAEEKIQMMFTLEEEHWKMPTYFWARAQKNRIDQFLDDLLEMTGKVRSSDEKHFEKYQIDEEQGIHLLIRDEASKTLANVIIGKRAEDQNSGFVRFAGKSKVYAVNKNLLSSLNIFGDTDTLSHFQQKSYVDLQAVDEKKEDLQIAVITANRKQMVIQKVKKEVEVVIDDSTTGQKTEEFWVLKKERDRETKLDQQEANKFLLDITRIRAQEAVDRISDGLEYQTKALKYGFQSSTHFIAFATGQSQKRIRFGKEYEKDKGYYMLVEYDGLVYKLNKSTFDKIFKWMDDLPEKIAK